MSARSWSISLGKVGIAYACDLTGGAATLTFLQEASANAINALFPDPARERVVRFLDDVEVKLQGDIDAGRLEEERMPVLLSHAEDLLRRHVFGSYDLGLVAGNPGKAVERALRRGERLLQSLGGDDRQYLRQILISFFEVLAADYDLFSDLQEAFRHELGADIAGIEARLDGIEDVIGDLRAEFGRWLRAIAEANIITDGLRMPERISPAVLVRAEYGVLPFFGRDVELSKLKDWCGTQDKIAVRILHGPGGMGKTRLLMELIGDLRSDNEQWRAGFLADDAGPRLATAISALLRRGQPLLIAIDYAETRQDDLLALFAACRDNLASNRIRIILLARSAGEWSEDLLRKHQSRYLSAEGLVEIQEIMPLAPDPVERGTLAMEARDLFADLLPAENAPAALPDLSAEHYDAVLYIAIAAFHASRGETVGEREKLLGNLVDRESDYWANHERLSGLHLQGSMLEPAAALFTLLGRTTRPSAIEHLECVSYTGDEARRELIADVFQDFLPVEEAGQPERAPIIGAVKPDLVGEHLVARVLRADPNFLEEVLSQPLTGDQDATALTVMGRAALAAPELHQPIKHLLESDMERFAAPAMDVAIQTNAAFGRTLAALLSQNSDAALAVRIESRLPAKTVALRDFAVIVISIIYAQFKQTDKPAREAGYQREFAAVASKLAYRLSEVGRREEAVPPAQEAVELYRDLAEQNPDAFTPDLAGSLNNLANRLSEVGRREEAVLLAQEAVEFYRALAEQHPDAFTADLAMSLINLANGLSEVGRREEAVPVAQEAAELYRALAEQHPDAFTPDLAGSLNNLANRLSEVDRREEAVPVAQEAVALWRALAE